MLSIIFYSISLWFLTFFNCLILLLIFVRFLVRVSYLEIYNEDVRDLLGKDQNARLEVCQEIHCSRLCYTVPAGF